MARGQTYADRRAAGAVLGGHLREFAGCDVVVLGLPRGGTTTDDEVRRLIATCAAAPQVRRSA